MSVSVCVVGWQEGSGWWWWAFDTWHHFLKARRVGCSCGWMCGTKTASVSVTVCGCETAREKGILKDSHRNVSVYLCNRFKRSYIYITPHCLCVCFSSHLPPSAHSERCVWLVTWLQQVGFFLSSTYFPDPGPEVSSVRPSLLPAPPRVSASFSICWLIQTWDFLYRRRRCPGSCGLVWYHQCPRTGHSPPEISSRHLCASRKRKMDTFLET